MREVVCIVCKWRWGFISVFLGKHTSVVVLERSSQKLLMTGVSPSHHLSSYFPYPDPALQLPLTWTSLRAPVEFCPDRHPHVRFAEDKSERANNSEGEDRPTDLIKNRGGLTWGTPCSLLSGNAKIKIYDAVIVRLVLYADDTIKGIEQVLSVALRQASIDLVAFVKVLRLTGLTPSHVTPWTKQHVSAA